MRHFKQNRDNKDGVEFLDAQGRVIKRMESPGMAGGRFKRTFKGKTEKVGGYEDFTVAEGGKGVLLWRSIQETETTARGGELQYFDGQGNLLWEKESKPGWSLGTGVVSDDGELIVVGEVAMGDPLQLNDKVMSVAGPDRGAAQRKNS